ncbi:MAG: NosD domain-containing protein [Candidatus Thorarchaeota archaeon]
MPEKDILMRRASITLSSIFIVVVTLALQSLLWSTPALTQNSPLLMVSSSVRAPAYEPHEPIEIISDLDFTEQGWPGHGIESDPYVIEDYEIRGQYSCIFISNTSAYFVISNCFLMLGGPQGNGPAVLCHNVTHGTVQNCVTVDKNLGMFLMNCSHFVIANNTVVRNFGALFGIYVLNSYSCTVTNNIITDAGSGLRIHASEDCTVDDNVVYGTNRGIHVTDSGHCLIVNNTSFRNAYGISLLANDSEVVGNVVYGNIECGVSITSGSSSNSVFGNAIGWNGVRNAEDDGNSTTWDDNASIGNSWSDYLGAGAYAISGAMGGIDRWPSILTDSVSPTISHPDDFSYEMGSRGHTITWSPSDLFPYSFQIQRDAEEVASGTWNGSPLSISIDGLLPATYTFTVDVLDANGNSAIDSVQVTVLVSDEPTIDHPADIECVVGSTGNSITWTPEDLFPQAYQIFRNDTEADSGPWDGSPITVSVDGLGIGTYNYTLTVSDEAGNLVIDTVFVYVRLHITGPETFSLLGFAFWLAVLAIEVAAAFFIVSRYRRIRGVKQSEPGLNDGDVLLRYQWL